VSSFNLFLSRFGLILTIMSSFILSPAFAEDTSQTDKCVPPSHLDKVLVSNGVLESVSEITHYLKFGKKKVVSRSKRVAASGMFLFMALASMAYETPDLSMRVFHTDSHWAQNRVDSSAMNARTQEILASRNQTALRVPVLVLDGNFDLPRLSRLNPGGNFPLTYFEKSSASGSEPHHYCPAIVPREKDGHGTKVASLISGSDSNSIVDQGIDLCLYHTDLQHSHKELLSVCKKASKVIDSSAVTLINYSISYEDGNYLEEEVDRELLTELAKNGCLVIKAAGNSAFKRDPRRFSIHDSFLQVESSNYQNELASHSNTGEVRAPGQSVPWHDSLWLGRYADGTSFAAPIVTAISAQVLRVLESSPQGYFRKLAPEERVSFISQLIAHSEKNGIVNGLNAVEIAERWNQKSEKLKKPAPIDLFYLENLKKAHE
jgi:hypothetical protein